MLDPRTPLLPQECGASLYGPCGVRWSQASHSYVWPQAYLHALHLGAWHLDAWYSTTCHVGLLICVSPAGPHLKLMRPKQLLRQLQPPGPKPAFSRRHQPARPADEVGRATYL